jgi:hypothetical protein
MSTKPPYDPKYLDKLQAAQRELFQANQTVSSLQARLEAALDEQTGAQKRFEAARLAYNAEVERVSAKS